MENSEGEGEEKIFIKERERGDKRFIGSIVVRSLNADGLNNTRKRGVVTPGGWELIEPRGGERKFDNRSAYTSARKRGPLPTRRFRAALERTLTKRLHASLTSPINQYYIAQNRSFVY